MQMFIVVRRRVSTGGQSGEHIRQTPMAGHLDKNQSAGSTYEFQ